VIPPDALNILASTAHCTCALCCPPSIFAQHSTALTITAEGNAVCKAVSVAEIIKRRLRGLHQNTQIGLTKAAAAAASGASAAAAAPTIAITLSTTPLDVSQPGYQPPLTDEELHAAWIFDEEAARLDALGLGEAAAAADGADQEELQPVEDPPAAADGSGAGEIKQRSRTRKRKRGGGRGAGAAGRGAASVVVAPRPRAEDSGLTFYE
jgi:DNA-binding protein